MSRWGDYGRGGRVAADAAAATTLKSCMKDWGDVFWTLCETSRKDWMVTRLFDTLKMEPILNRVGEAVGLDGIGTGLKGLSKAAVWVVGIVKKEPREKLKQAAKSTVTIVKKATKSFLFLLICPFYPFHGAFFSEHLLNAPYIRRVCSAGNCYTDNTADVANVTLGSDKEIYVTENTRHSPFVLTF